MAWVLIQLSTVVFATPTIALKESNNCAACHKPGRSQRPYFQRRCTLDCQGCHIDPSGGGPRNQWGAYYSQTNVGPNSFNFFEPEDPLKDTSRLDTHLDARYIQRHANGKVTKFPMSLEASVRLRPFVEYLHLTYQFMFMGRKADEVFRMPGEGGRRYREKFAVMVDQLPLNTYVKAARGTPMYGLRRPNHTLWIRERIGLDQFAVTDAVQFGFAPNVPYFHGSLMRGDPYVAASRRQKGWTYHAGMRGVTLGWHVNTSGWSTKSSDTDIKMTAIGAGLNLFGLILYGEQNKRQVSSESTGAVATRLHPSSTIGDYTATLALIPGLMVSGVYETYADELRSQKRRSAVVDWHPIPFLQFELWRRFESGERDAADTLAIAHVYFDF